MIKEFALIVSAVISANLLTAMFLFGFIRRWRLDDEGKGESDPRYWETITNMLMPLLMTLLFLYVAMS
jgi:hypothetical protein